MKVLIFVIRKVFGIEAEYSNICHSNTEERRNWNSSHSLAIGVVPLALTRSWSISPCLPQQQPQWSTVTWSSCSVTQRVTGRLILQSLTTIQTAERTKDARHFGRLVSFQFSLPKSQKTVAGLHIFTVNGQRSYFPKIMATGRTSPTWAKRFKSMKEAIQNPTYTEIGFPQNITFEM